MSAAVEPVTDPAPRPTGMAHDGRSTGWGASWPVRGREATRLAVAFLIVTGTGVLLGLAVTDWWAPNAITRFDDRAANAFADNRTDFLTDLSPWAAGTTDTFVKIGISTVIVAILLWKFRRWEEGLYVALPLVFEAACFVTITKIVARPRPDVERLIDSTIKSSFPSGHVAAATVYAAVVVVIWRHSRSTFVRVLSAAVVVVIVIAVVWARLYQGMHFVSDTVVGIILGATSLYVTDRILSSSAQWAPDAPSLAGVEDRPLVTAPGDERPSITPG